MNHTDVVSAVASKTGLSPELCNTVIKSFEDVVGLQILTKMGKKDLVTEELLGKVVSSSGASQEDSRAILTALNETLSEGISKKTH